MSAALFEFVHQSLELGLTREQIAQGLKEGGWSAQEIQTALDAFVDAGLPLPVPKKRASASPREAFLFLVLFCSLYTWIFALGTLCFDLLNIALIQPGEVALHWIGSLRAGMASVMVAFPLFVFMQYLTAAEARQNPGQRISPIRRWLTYLTLFAAAAAVVSDLIVLGLHFLEGEVTLRFLLKVLVVALLAGSAFTYYLRQLKQDERSPSLESASNWRYGIHLLAGLIILVMGLAFWNAGSPLKARQLRQDQARIQDLRAIENSIRYYYDAKGVLPADLSACDTSTDTFVESKRDPVTGKPYRYRVLDPIHAEIGADFARPSQPLREDDGFWKHGAGPTDFRIEVRKRP